MALINTSLPNLIQGVSQQSDAVRYDGQCEEQENALSSVVAGLKKRPNTRHIARLLGSAIANDSFVHFIDRDDLEKYVVIHNGSTIEAWNILDGTKCEINGSTNPFTPPNYLATDTPRQQLKALTVADNTFIVNRDVPVGISPTNTAALEKKGFAYIAQGDYEKKYILKLGGNIAGATAGDAATFTVNVVSYYHGEGWNRFKIESVDIDNEGSGYGSGDDITLDLTFNWGSLGNTTPTTYNAIIVMPVVTASFVDDGTGDGTYKVGGVTVTTAGSFASHDASRTGYDFGTDYGASIAATVAGDAVSGVTYTFSTEGTRDTVASDADTNNIAQSLFSGDYESAYFAESPLLDSSIFIPTTTEISSGVYGDGYMTATREGNTIILEHNLNDGDFTLTTSDGLAGAGIKGVYKKTDSLSDLPLRAPNNFKVEISGDFELDQDNYWVQFKTHSGEDFGNGDWEETVAPDVPKGVASPSMPMTIQSVDLNKLEIKTIDYLERGAGDDETNPDPSFVGKTINDIVFFKNRLGFVTDESVVFSEAGEFFNFYRTTVSSLLDSDPIDVSVASTKVTNLKHAVGFQGDLMLFSDNSQFVLKGADILTPKTVSISAATSFNVDTSVPPLPLGSYVYFPFARGNYTGINEFVTNANTDNFEAIEITDHVPAYIPANIKELVGSTSEETLAVLSADEPDALYVYSYFWNSNQKVLSSWSKFTFSGDIRGLDFVDSSLYIVCVCNNETHLVELPLASGLEDAAGYTTHLDMRVSASLTAGDTVLPTLPYTPSDNSVQVYTKDGLKLQSTNSGATVTLNQAVTEDTDVWVGLPYTMKYTFSEQLFKAKAGNGTSPSNAAKTMVRNGSVYYEDAAYFQVKVTPKARQTYVNTFTPDVVGASTIGSLNLTSGFFRFPVFTKAADTTITIENDSALPSNFQSAEFESFVHSRSNRYG